MTMAAIRDRAAGFFEKVGDGFIALALRIDPGASDPRWPEPQRPSPGTIIPRDLGMLGQATSDSGYLVLEAIAAVQGPRTAADAAAGYADAYARFAVSHPDAFD